VAPVVGGGDGEVLQHQGNEENDGDQSIDDTSHRKAELTEEGGGGSTSIESQ
jgi:hypothetical protein